MARLMNTITSACKVSGETAISFTALRTTSNSFLAELRSQLVQLESTVVPVPGCIIQELLQKNIESSEQERKALSKEHSQSNLKLQQAKVIPQFCQK